MRCGLIDIPCQLWAWFLGLAWWVHLGLAICLALVAWGLAARLWSLARAVGGWQAAVGAVGVLGLVVAALWPRGRIPESHENVDGRDAAPPPRPRGRRRFNADTGQWE